MKPDPVAPDYWPDLTQMPDGWRIVQIMWQNGRALVELRRNSDALSVWTSGNHRTPGGAFDVACKTARRTP
jgi:hypothetical protein